MAAGPDRFRWAWFVALLCAGKPVAGQAVGVAPVQGLRESRPAIHALVGARLVIAPGRVVENGTLLLRDGRIEAVGADLAIPPAAKRWDLRGKTIYPGFIDAYSERSAPVDVPPAHEPASWNPHVRPHLRAEQSPPLDAAARAKLRSQGITAQLAAPADGIIKGTSALTTSADGPLAATLLQSAAALHLKLTVPRGASRETYPTSPMGALALVRQTLYDAEWQSEALARAKADSRLPRPEANVALDAIRHHRRGGRPFVIDAPDEWYFLRADALTREFGLPAILRGSGREYRRLDAIRATGLPVILPVHFPAPPDVQTPEFERWVTLERLLHWDLAPENPGRLAKAGVGIAFTTHGLKDAGDFLKNLRKAVARGLAPEAALTALTVAPAGWFGLSERMGTLESGKQAHLVVAEGDLFQTDAKVLETWIDGQRHPVEPESLADVRGTWDLRSSGGNRAFQARLELSGEPDKLSGTIRAEKDQAQQKQAKPNQAKLERAVRDAVRLTLVFERDALGQPGTTRLSVPLSGDSALGQITWPDGSVLAVEFRRVSGEPRPAAEASAGSSLPRSASEPSPVWFPLGASGRAAPPEAPPAVLFQQATVWTCAAAGRLERADVLVESGRITRVAPRIEPPAKAVIVDARGKHLTPGIIDCHSHIATDGGVNEAGQAITAEVRIGDFIDPDDINLYRQLAGGVTTANILHGSANPIGGQNQVVKFRWGALPEELKFAAAPPGIKCALGENVKQSNWGERFTTRYPQSRLGVEQLVLDAFHAARQYRRDHDAWRRDARGLPPRVDLELEALVEVLEGKRLIHCHSYRQDEIVTFLRVCEQFGVQVATLQHVLEGYKVADAIARHGAGASAFSDWWAYKFEVLDAIPHNGALLRRAGVTVSFNSDSAELARRLNTEAAKAEKYGGVPPQEALKFVTLHPAQQLRIADRVGSLEPGKDADLVLWSGPPLSGYSRCEQTWIDGRKYFDLHEDLGLRNRDAALRARLIQKALASGEKPTAIGEEEADERELWPREDLFCHDHDHEEGHSGHE